MSYVICRASENSPTGTVFFDRFQTDSEDNLIVKVTAFPGDAMVCEFAATAVYRAATVEHHDLRHPDRARQYPWMVRRLVDAA